jgi:hypothetical protein
MNIIKKKRISLLLALCLILLCSCDANAPDEYYKIIPDTSPQLAEDALNSPEDTASPRIIIYEEAKRAYININDTPLLFSEATGKAETEPFSTPPEPEIKAEPEEQGEPAVTAGYMPYIIKVNRLANCVTVYTYDLYGEYTVPVRAMVCSCGGENTHWCILIIRQILLGLSSRRCLGLILLQNRWRHIVSLSSLLRLVSRQALNGGNTTSSAQPPPMAVSA